MGFFLILYHSKRVRLNYSKIGVTLHNPSVFTENRIFRSSLPEVFCKKGLLENITKFIRKHLRQSLFFNKVTGLMLIVTVQTLGPRKIDFNKLLHKCLGYFF